MAIYAIVTQDLQVLQISGEGRWCVGMAHVNPVSRTRSDNLVIDVPQQEGPTHSLPSSEAVKFTNSYVIKRLKVRNGAFRGKARGMHKGLH